MKKIWNVMPRAGKWRKLVLIMKLKLFILLCCLQGVHANVLSQQRYDVSFQEETVLSVIDYLRQHTGYEFFYLEQNLADVGNVSVTLKQATLSEILDNVLRAKGLSYEIQDNVVIIKLNLDEEKKSVTVKGFVYDEIKQPLPGVTVRVPGVSVGTATNTQGWFSIDLPMLSGKLEFSFVGYESQQVDFNQNTDTLRVILKEASQAIDEVVVTGIFNRPKESFTGAVRAISREELQTHYSRNLIQTIANLDPSLRIIQNNEMGSDPNTLPELQLRGSSTLRSTDDIRNNMKDIELNQPLFILDGFEVDLEQVIDLNDANVESITILKDASATALYGSRGANGVIVITTLRPRPGKITVSYMGDLNIEIPDLSTYDDLTTASEKLEIERIYGVWNDPADQEMYDELKAAVDNGLNYNWAKEPVRTGVGQQHVLSLMGGTPNWRFNASLFYDAVLGVMEGSDRKNFSGTLNITYTQGKWNVRQLVSIGRNSNADSPYGLYSYYVQMNRYWTPYDKNGDLVEYFDHPNLSSTAGYVENPMYDKEVGCWNKTTYTSLRSTTEATYEIGQAFSLSAMFGITWVDKNADSFRPPIHRYYESENIEQKGEYSRGETTENLWEARLTLNYAKTFNDKHMVTIGLAGEMSEEITDYVSWTATGFMTSNIDHLSSSLGYPTTGGTYGSKDVVRRLSISGFANYYYDSRYFLDLTYRLDGGSSFGENSRFSSFYAIGAGWTIGKEQFVEENLPFISDWSLRYSYGVSGNMAFAPSQAMEVFNRNTEYTYNGGIGVSLSQFANPDLKQQNTFQHNVGMDMSLFNDNLSLTINYYNKLTDNTLTTIELAASHGFESVSGNIGKIRNVGWDGNLNVKLLKSQMWDWSLTASFSKNKETLVELSEGFKKDLEYYDLSLSSGDDYLRYREGHSLSAIYGLRTIGVDPLSGQRIFLTKDGEMTMNQTGEDLVYLGDSQPKVNSAFSTTVSYGNLSLSVGFNAVWGGVAINSTELNKRENLNLTYNIDRQVLTDGWQHTGDKALYKRQGQNVSNTYTCDMFIHKNNYFSCNSINVRYNLPKRWINKIGMQMCSISVLLGDIFYLSTIHRERGTSYPYSKNPKMSISCTF